MVLTALRAEDGSLRGFLKITHDLTEHRKIDELQISNRQKDEFLAALSHELRTHLNAILGWVCLMRESRDDEAVISQGLEVVERNTETVTELTSSLVDISRINTGTIALNFEDVELKELVRSAIETLRVKASRKGITLKSCAEVPQLDGPTVFGDKTALRQILTNILNNAVKFTPEGGSVTVSFTKAEATAILTVRDSGIGMSPDFLPHVFDQFAQAKSSTGESPGMGLGLAICKHLVDLHNGLIKAESDGLGRGSTFTVKLPLKASNSPLSCEPTGEFGSPKEVALTDTRLKSIKVLAVDDDRDTRELLKAILKRSSADATVVASGEEALQTLKNVRSDILVSDLAMSQMDGYELLENVRRLEPEIGYLPSIAFTASAREEDRTRTRRAGFQAHLAKPVAADELVTTIADLVKHGSK